jgi:hypothetical protein
MYTAALVPPVQPGDRFSPSVMTQVRVDQVEEAIITVERRNGHHPVNATSPL